MQLKDKIRQLSRRYKNITADNCFYNDKKELKRLTKQIIVQALVQTESMGSFVAEIIFTSRHLRNYDSWVDYWKHPQNAKNSQERAFLKHRKWKKYPSIQKILEDYLVPSMGNKYNEVWELLEVIGWQLLKGEKK